LIFNKYWAKREDLTTKSSVWENPYNERISLCLFCVAFIQASSTNFVFNIRTCGIFGFIELNHIFPGSKFSDKNLFNRYTDGRFYRFVSNNKSTNPTKFLSDGFGSCRISFYIYFIIGPGSKLESQRF
jgi:hypothetical protein